MNESWWFLKLLKIMKKSVLIMEVSFKFVIFTKLVSK